MTADFLDIVQGRKPCLKLVEDSEFLSFLSETPMRLGHSLVIPKDKVESLFEMDDKLLGRLMVFAKKVAGLLKVSVPCVKVGLMVAGIQVRHTHLHLVPIDQPSDLDFSKQAPAAAEELRALQKRITGVLGEL